MKPAKFLPALHHVVVVVLVAIAIAAVPSAHSISEKIPAAATIVADASDDDHVKFASLVDWIRTNGGRVDKRLGIGRHTRNSNNHHGDFTVVRGAVALDDIPANVELLFTPWKLVLGTEEGDSSDVSNDKCKILQEYAQEVGKGTDSFWFHYLAMDDSLSACIPMLWNESVLDELQGLPPGDKQADSSLLDWFSTSCHGNVPFEHLDQAVRQSLMAAVTRSASMRFLPLYDLLNHHNGQTNVESSASRNGNTITTTQAIEKGREIFISYRGGGSEATSSEIFRRYGFVEEWPQHWTWISSSENSEHGGAGYDGDSSNGSGDAQQKQAQFHEERFLISPNGIVTLYPTETMLAAIGTTSLLPYELLSHAYGTVHNDLLTSAQLLQFYQSGKQLLQSLATSVQEDIILLKDLIENNNSHKLASYDDATGASLFNINQERMIHARNQIEATKYRLEFKRAIELSIGTAKTCLDKRRQQEL
jgi:hypothetical protein